MLVAVGLTILFVAVIAKLVAMLQAGVKAAGLRCATASDRIAARQARLAIN